MANYTSRWRRLTPHDAGLIVVVSLGILGMSIMLLIGMGFQPGWANGWPISKHAVFATFVTCICAVASTSGMSGILIALCFVIERISKRSFVGWVSFIMTLLIVSALVLIACPHVYARVHAEIVREWP